MIDEIAFFDTLRQGLWISVVIATPILFVALSDGCGGWAFPGADVHSGNDADLCAEACVNCRRLLAFHELHVRKPRRLLDRASDPAYRGALNDGQLFLYDA